MTVITDGHREQATAELAQLTPVERDRLLEGMYAAFLAYEDNPRELAQFAFETTAVVCMGKLGA